MKLNNIILASLILICLSCQQKAQSIIRPNNTEIDLHLLFEHEGCKVYRFIDGSTAVYWSDCRGNTQTSYYNAASKTMVYKYMANNGR